MKSILLALISFVICLALEMFIIAQKDIFIAIGLMAFWFVILVPVLSFLYSRRALSGVRRKWLYALWHAFVVALSYAAPLCMELETYPIALVIFVWAFGWGALGLIPTQKSKQEKLI